MSARISSSAAMMSISRLLSSVRFSSACEDGAARRAEDLAVAAPGGRIRDGPTGARQLSRVAEGRALCLKQAKLPVMFALRA